MTIFPKSQAPIGLQLVSLLLCIFPFGVVLFLILYDLADALINGPGYHLSGLFFGLGLVFFLPPTIPFLVFGCFLAYIKKYIVKIIALVILAVNFTIFAILLILNLPIDQAINYSGLIFLIFIIFYLVADLLSLMYLFFGKKMHDYFLK